MGAKKTSDFIPFCHQVPLDKCDIKIDFNKENKNQVIVESEVVTHHKTGVEMEALNAVSIASLTIYDMCKALSHHIVIKDIRLIEKSGGKSTFKVD